MKKPDIAKRMARRSHVTQGEAADELDRIVRQILSDLRAGKDTALPGLGKFTTRPDGRVAFHPERGGSRG
jgi:nucleoid DNA-binding protein